jgi:general secretion pathway protein B
MSYILEAMRRAEAERHRGEVPQINAPEAPAPAPAPTKKQSALPGIGLSAVLGLGIGFAGYALLKPWLSPPPPPPPPVAAAGVGAGGALPSQAWGSAGPPAAGDPVRPGPARAEPMRPEHSRAEATKASREAFEPKPAPAVPAGRAVAEASKSSVPAPGALGGTPPSPPAAGPQGSPRAPSAPPLPAAAPRPAVPAAPSPSPAPTPWPAPQSGVAQTAPPTPAPVSASLPRLRDLPPELQREVPPLLVSGWVQSADPGSRQLLVNGMLLREGDALTPVMRLEQIGTRSAVFSVRGQRFEVPISL